MTTQTKKITQYIVLLLIAAAIGFIIYITLTKDKVNTEVGDKAPDFQLKTLDGRTVSLSDYKGKGLILNFWGTWCEPCKKEMPALNKAYNAYKDKDVEVLAIHIKKNPQQIKQFFSGLKEEVQFKIAMDNGNEVTEAYNIDPLPTTYVIDKNGMIQAVQKSEMDYSTIVKYMKSVTP